MASAEVGAWLNALPVPSLGTKLDDESLCIALGLYLGAAIVVKHSCVCGYYIKCHKWWQLLAECDVIMHNYKVWLYLQIAKL